jgi:hypothetical protein
MTLFRPYDNIKGADEKEELSLYDGIVDYIRPHFKVGADVRLALSPIYGQDIFRVTGFYIHIPGSYKSIWYPNNREQYHQTLFFRLYSLYGNLLHYTLWTKQIKFI